MIIRRHNNGKPLVAIGHSFRRMSRGIHRDLCSLVPLFGLDAASMRDLITAEDFESAAWNARTSVTAGLGVRCSYASQVDGGPPLKNTTQPIITSTGDGLGDFTMHVVARPRRQTRRSEPFCQRSSGGPEAQARIEFNSSNMSAAAGRITVGTKYSSWTRDRTGTAVIQNDKWLWVTFTRKGSRLSCHVNGKLETTLTGTIRKIWEPPGEYAIVGPANDTQNRNVIDPVILAAAWNRALTEDEIVNLWHPQTRWDWVHVPSTMPYAILDAPPVVTPASYDMLV